MLNDWNVLLGHLAAGLAGKRAAPEVSLATWFAAVQLADLVWPVLLLAGVEHVRVAPGITAFTPLDFVHYPYTHSLVSGIAWAVVFAGSWLLVHRRRGARAGSGPSRIRARHHPRVVALLLAAAVLSHWILDVVTHRPDMPVLFGGPYVGLDLWYSVPATLIVELTLFALGVWLYASGIRRHSQTGFWLLIALLIVIYFGAAFGPPPPDAVTVAFSALALWILIPWAWYVDRSPVPPVLNDRGPRPG